MEKYHLENDLKVFGVEVESFPNGIGEAFDKLSKTLPQGEERTYYGISHCINGYVTYIAAASETYDGEGSKYGYESYTIERGQYLTAPLVDWTLKTHCIKDVFEEIIKDERVDKMQPAVEVYKNMKEMVCMVKIDERKEILFEFDKAMKEFVSLISSLDNEELNVKPSATKWSAGQVADHVHQSHSGFAQMINGPVEDTKRNPYKWIETIKNDFADFSIKMKSPDFVLPKSDYYEKDLMLDSLLSAKLSLDHTIRNVDLTKTCSLFELPVYGYLTSAEALWFVICHTQRHLHQLKDIERVVKHQKELTF